MRFAKPGVVGAADTDHVLYERSLRVKAKAGTETVARIVEPYFDRNYLHFCSHSQTPNRLEASPYAAAAIKGRCAYAAFPAFAAFG